MQISPANYTPTSSTWAIESFTTLGVGLGTGIRSVGSVAINLIDLENCIKYEGYLISLTLGVGAPVTGGTSESGRSTFRTRPVNIYDFDGTLAVVTAFMEEAWFFNVSHSWIHFTGVNQYPINLNVGGEMIGFSENIGSVGVAYVSMKIQSPIDMGPAGSCGDNYK